MQQIGHTVWLIHPDTLQPFAVVIISTPPPPPSNPYQVFTSFRAFLDKRQSNFMIFGPVGSPGTSLHNSQSQEMSSVHRRHFVLEADGILGLVTKLWGGGWGDWSFTSPQSPICHQNETAPVNRHRGNTYLTSLPLVSVHHHGRVNSVKSRDKFHLECKLHFPSTHLILRQMHLPTVSASIEAK